MAFCKKLCKMIFMALIIYIGYYTWGSLTTLSSGAFYIAKNICIGTFYLLKTYIFRRILIIYLFKLLWGGLGILFCIQSEKSLRPETYHSFKFNEHYKKWNETIIQIKNVQKVKKFSEILRF